MGRTITLDEIGERTASDLLHQVAREHVSLRVVLETGDVVTIASGRLPTGNGDREQPILKPLTVLPGYVPAGWKDAIYDYSDSES